MGDTENDEAAARRPRAGRIARWSAASVAVLLAGAWFGRLYLAETLIRTALGGSAGEADLRVKRLDFGGADFSDIRVGKAEKPDFWAKSAHFDFDWSHGVPRLQAIAVADGGARWRLDTSASAAPRAKAAGHAEIPDWAIAIKDFHLIGETPFGAFDAALSGGGRLRRDFRGEALITPADLSGPQGLARNFSAKLDIQTLGGALVGVLHASADEFILGSQADAPDARLGGVRASVEITAPLDLSGATARLALRGRRLSAANTLDAADAAFKADVRMGAFASDFQPADMSGAYEAALGHGVVSGLTIDGAAARGPLALEGPHSLRAWRGKDTLLALEGTRATLGADGAGARVRAQASVAAPIAGLKFVDARAPLDLDLQWRAGFRVTTTGGACAPIDLERLDAGGVIFVGAKAALCPAASGVFAAADAKDQLSGGFSLDRIAWPARMSGGEPARLEITRVEGTLLGAISAPVFDVNAAAPDFSANFAQGRKLHIGAARLSARFAGGAPWSLSGAANGIDAEDTSLPGRVTGFDALLHGAPDRGGAPVFTFDHGAGSAHANDEAPLFHPLLVRDVSGALRDGRITARGDLILAEKPAQTIGAFTLAHDLDTGKGEARVSTQAQSGAPLAFSSALQPYDISELARGLIDSVRGPVDAALWAQWAGDSVTTGARAELDSISFATAALGAVDGVSGTITFDDLAAMTTPPHQTLHIASMNPGVTIENGVIAFQLLPQQRLALESAHWPFANGDLSIEPAVVQLGADQSRLSIAATGVDAATLIKQLNINGLTATGEVQGRFPLVFTATKGRIEHGRLEAAPGGGVIAYTGELGAQSGAARLAFDALRSFHYDSLSLDLDGDLDGELVSAIRFAGRNQEPVNPGASVLPLKVVGIPFKFTVTVQAPFVALAQNAAGFSDARQYLRDIQVEQTGAPPPPSPPSGNPP